MARRQLALGAASAHKATMRATHAGVYADIAFHRLDDRFRFYHYRRPLCGQRAKRGTQASLHAGCDAAMPGVHSGSGQDHPLHDAQTFPNQRTLSCRHASRRKASQARCHSPPSRPSRTASALRLSRTHSALRSEAAWRARISRRAQVPLPAPLFATAFFRPITYGPYPQKTAGRAQLKEKKEDDCGKSRNDRGPRKQCLPLNNWLGRAAPFTPGHFSAALSALAEVWRLNMRNTVHDYFSQANDCLIERCKIHDISFDPASVGHQLFPQTAQVADESVNFTARNRRHALQIRAHTVGCQLGFGGQVLSGVVSLSAYARL